MLVFDQLKKNDPQLRLLAVVVAFCLLVLLTGLWWVQVVKARDFRSSLENQSYRTVRLQSVRGKILDRNGEVLAENRAQYNISLYLEDLRPAFRKEYKRVRPTLVVTNDLVFWKKWLGAQAVKTNQVRLKPEQVSALEWDVRCHVVSQVIAQLATTLREPTLRLDTNEFKRHYDTRRALPFPVVRGATPAQLARFSEQLSGNIAADLEILSTRVYPNNSTAAHVLGYLRRDNSSADDMEVDYYHRLPDYRGVVGIEGYFDEALSGQAGGKSVLVNSMGFRQSETMISPTEPGRNVVLTLDLRVQKAAENAMRSQVGGNALGAVVVMDVNSGDILALSSSPASDPNYLIQGFPPMEWSRWTNAPLGLQKNRATREIYQPGSTFKTIVALAALEQGLNPREEIRVMEDPQRPGKGIFYIGNRRIKDTAPPGNYDLERALTRSSNTYFIINGLRPGVFERVARFVDQLHVTELVGLPLMQESPGKFPHAARKLPSWTDGNTANICIGQGELDMTPMQLTIMTAALANGGKVLKPRIVERLESQDPANTEPPTVFPNFQVRDQLRFKPANLAVIHDAMLRETEDAIEGTGKKARVEGLQICGKTGTAERLDDGKKENTTWFISFAPFAKPRYAVVVMVENGASGGGTCAPIAAEVYRALLQAENTVTNRALARNN